MTTENNNGAGTVHVTASTVKEIQVGQGGVEKINLTQIPFIPEISIMHLSTSDIVRALNATLKPIVDGYKGAKVYVKGNTFGVEIGLDTSSRLITKSVLRMLGEKTAFEMSEEFKAKLSVFVNPQAPINNRVVDANRHQQVMIVELDAVKVINQLLQTATEGFIYRLDKILDRKKNGDAIFQISMVRKNRPYEQRYNGDNRNKNHHKNNRNNNRDDDDRRDGNRNSNYKGNNYNSNYKGNNYNSNYRGNNNNRRDNDNY